MKSSSEERESKSQQASPNSHSSNSSSSSSDSNGVQHQSPSTPKTPNRSKINTDPTTFIQADTSSFKQVVQMLTGSSQTVKQASKTPSTTLNSLPKSIIPPIKTGQKKQGHKLYERRNSFKNLKDSPLMSGLVQNCGFSHRELEMLSPSMLNFPALVISPVTPLTPDPFNKSPTTYTNSKLSAVEQGRITETGCYTHSSPVTTPRGSKPRLLSLFPMTSPKITGTSI